MCRKQNYAEFVEKDSKFIKIKIKDQIESYEVLRVLEFDSVRKRMSVIVKSLQTGKVINFIKGADMAIEPRLTEETRDSALGQTTLNDMNSMASKGLRTLIFAMKELASDWDHEKLMEVKDLEVLESGINLLGVTGLEDLLQDNVA